jgi:hypothetical protein
MVKLGDPDHNSTLDDANLLILEIQEAIIHPGYDNVRVYFDIAVLVTKTVAFTKGIKPVCLPR